MRTNTNAANAATMAMGEAMETSVNTLRPANDATW
jgi:hypothetical protein